LRAPCGAKHAQSCRGRSRPARPVLLAAARALGAKALDGKCFPEACAHKARAVLMTTPQAPAAPPDVSDVPCSSNGDAAASLSALFAAASTDERSTGASTPTPAPELLPDAGGTAAVSSASEAKPPPDAWRLKFLHKVGIPSNNGSRASEAPPELGRLQTPPPPSEDERENGSSGAGSSGADEVVVVRQQAPRRSTDDIRLGYIKKLEHSRAFIPQLNRPKTSQTVTIFDWDDTLLCTSAPHPPRAQAPNAPRRPALRVPPRAAHPSRAAKPLPRGFCDRHRTRKCCRSRPSLGFVCVALCTHATPCDATDASALASYCLRVSHRPFGDGSASIWGNTLAGAGAARLARAHRQDAHRAGERTNMEVLEGRRKADGS
jgi:hypothetical protein